MLGSRRTKDFQAISGCMLLQNCGLLPVDGAGRGGHPMLLRRFLCRKEEGGFCGQRLRRERVPKLWENPKNSFQENSLQKKTVVFYVLRWYNHSKAYIFS